jgi:hypothetical protein
MSKSRGLILFLLLAVVFLSLNRGAYQGYFQDDEINAMQWTRWGPDIEYLKGALTPIYHDSFRAVGFYYFHRLGPAFGLDFPKYIAVLHLIHLFNVWILWLVMRRLGITAYAACLGCALFALHMALFDAIWKPMYVFDVLCGTFCLASLLLWIRGNWILSFISFWLAYKAKEVAVMLPLVLIAYELWFRDQRRWKTLAPFLAASCSFGLQALFLSPDRRSGLYVFHFTADAFRSTALFYARRVFLVPYLGFLLPLAGVAARNRRTWFGLAMMALFFVPLLFLPGRVFSAYCYVPFTGLAIAMAGLAEIAKPAVAAAVFLLWFPLNIHWMLWQRHDTLRQDRDIREWVSTVGNFARAGPPVGAFVYQGIPAGFQEFGVDATLNYFLWRPDVTAPAADSPEGIRYLRSGRTAVLRWREAEHRLDIETP